MRRSLLTAAALAVAVATSAHAQAPAESGGAPGALVTTVAANINITPKRVTIDPSRRNATIYVINQGAAPVTIDLAMVDRIMTPDGQIVAVEDAAKKPELAALVAKLHSAKEMVQISPRRVTLEPGKGQTVRIRLASLPEQVQAAEYRTHITVTTVPPPDTGVTAEDAATTGTSRQLSFRITAVYGISIPAIVRTAPAQPQAQLQNLRLETTSIREHPDAPVKTVPAVALEIIRQGPNSLYGSLEVRSEHERRDDPPIGLARGVGVYPEIDHRTVLIPLSRAPAPGEKLDVTFTDDDTSQGKVLAKSTF